MTEQRIENPFGGPVCDFCLRPNPRWSLDPKDSSVGSEVIELPSGARGVHMPSTSVWAACTRCATIIARGDLDTLATACAQSASARLAAIGVPGGIADEVERLRARFAEVIPGLSKPRLATREERSNPSPSFTLGKYHVQTPEAN